MCRFQSGPRLAAGSPSKPLRRFTAAASVTLCTTVAALVAPVAASAQAQLQPQKQQARPPSVLRLDPLNAQANVAPLVYESAFTQYRRLTDGPVGSWRDANDTVTRIGGWRAYAREAAQPASPAASGPAGDAIAPGVRPSEPAKAMPMPMPGGKNPHGGHKMK